MLALAADDGIGRGESDGMGDIGEFAFVLDQPVETKRPAEQRLAIGERRLRDVGALGLRIIDEAQRRAVARKAVADAETMLVIDLAIDGGEEVDHPPAPVERRLRRNARRAQAVPVERLLCLDPAADRARLHQDDVGEQRIACMS